MNLHRAALRHLAFGFAAGVITSIAPFEFAILLIPVFMVVWVLAAKGRPAASGITSYVMAGVVALVVITIAVLLPVKQLDRKVGPIRYERMSLEALCRALSKDYQVFVGAPYPEGTNMFLEFHTDRPIRRREVLQKLANDIGCDLRIGSCGNGASFLFGAHPSFTRLYVRGAHTGGGAKLSQPVRMDKNQPSPATASGR